MNTPLTSLLANGRALTAGGVRLGVSASYAYIGPSFVIATPTGGNGSGYYGLFNRQESNLSGMWYSYNSAPGPPSGTTGGGMVNSDPNTGAGYNLAVFEIHFDGTGIQLWGLSNSPYGEARILLDNAMQGNCSYHDGSGSTTMVYAITGLPAGRHVFRHECLNYDGTNKSCIPQYYRILG